MARKSQKEAERTRARIMASALDLFAKRGYEKTTFNEIAARLKMTKGAVYWHFESKLALLTAIIDEMLEKFRRQIFALLPPDCGGDAFSALTFPAVAGMMVRNALLVVEDPRSTAFFMLMHTQVRWGDRSMSQVREDIIANKQFGPLQVFRAAVENDKRAGRVRRDVDALKVASVCMAIWDGLVRSRIDRFLQCDLKETLEKSYGAVWDAIGT